jgi:hypothetical protein
MMEKLKEIKAICNGIEYSRDVPEEAKAIAKENNIVIIVGGSDDLMYCYGADCYLTDYVEHGEGWDGCNLKKHASEKKLRKEAKQLGLKIFWCGSIKETGETIKDYNIDESGSFYYSVKKRIKALDFKVMEDEEVYCTGKIIQLPDDFVKANK